MSEDLGKRIKKILTVETLTKDLTIKPGPEHMSDFTAYWKNNINMALYPLQEKVIRDVFEKYPDNKDEDIIRFKVRLIDNYYSTNLKEGFGGMVDNIYAYKDFDHDVQDYNINVINAIRITTSHLSADGEKDCLSFASKYCSHHSPSKYPIYDSYVKRMLYLLNLIYKFTDRFTLKEIDSNYSFYKEVIDSFIKTFFDKPISYKDFDRYIWTWAKKIIIEYDN